MRHVIVKSESETRWSVRVAAVKPVHKYLKDMLNLLQGMTDNSDQTNETRIEARLHNRMLSYDFLTLLGFWNDVLVSINRVQKSIQVPSMNFHNAALDIKACDSILQMKVLVNEDVATEKRQLRKTDARFGFLLDVKHCVTVLTTLSIKKKM